MNWSIYQSFARIPIGLAVTLEFVGPLTLAVLGSRRARDLIWVGLAGLGVLLLGLQPGDLTWAGVGFALLAGGCWAAYILLSAQTGRRWQGVDGLAVASVVATLLLTPLALGRYADQLADARILLIGALVGLLSSVIPYTCELVALRTLRPAVFSILMSLEPAAAALAGLVVVHELLGPVQLVGDGLRGGRERRRHPVRRDDLRTRCRTDRSEALRRFSSNCSRTLYKGVMTRGARWLASCPLPLPPVRSHTMTSLNPLSPSVRRLDRVRAWSVESQQGARRNAMVANTALAARRAERQDVDAYFAALRPQAVGAAGSRTARPASSDTRSDPPAGTADPPSGRIEPMPTSAARVAPAPSITYHDVLSDDGTRLTAWTNDPDGTIDGPTVVLCNGLGTGPWTWPALLRPDCGVRIVSWNHRGTGGSDRPADPAHCGIEAFVEDTLSVMDHFGVDRAPVMGWSMGVNTMFELAFRHPERVSGLFAVAGRARRHLRDHAGAAQAAAPGRARASRSTSPGR